MRRVLTLLMMTAGLLVPAGAATAAAPATAPAGHDRFPTTIALPLGFPPEGIAIGGTFAYFGSRLDGSIYRADLRTGAGRIISPGPGTPSLGLKIDRRGRLFVAGGTGADARVIDARTGAVLARYPLISPGFVNDVVLTRDAAWFTDSANPVLYKLTFGRHGALPATATRLPLTGDLVFGAGTNADGLLRIGRTLFVVQNRLNVVAVLRLNRAGTRARLVTRVTDPRFAIPTTVAAFRHRLYLPNAQFTVMPTPTTPYNAVAIPRPATG